MLPKIFRFILIVGLIIQVTTLSFHPPIPSVTIGDIHQKSATVASANEEEVVPADALLEEGGAVYHSILFVGDIMLGRFVEQLMRREGDSYPFAGLPLTTLAEQPALVGNFEASVPRIHSPTPNYHLRFSVPSSSLPVLKNAGFTHLSLGNNHSYDHAEAGFIHSIEAITAAGMVPFGSEVAVTEESLTYITTKAGMIALLAINNSDAPVEREMIAQLLHEASTQSVLQIVYVHWGIEYQPTHSRVQKQLAVSLVDAGADVIIGHHPHVVQDVDSIQGVPVFYSLGNYIFDQYFSTPVQQGLVLALEFQNGSAAIRLHPVSSIGRLSQPYLQTESERARFLTKLANTSHPDLTQQIKAGVIQLPITFATSSKMAMINR